MKKQNTFEHGKEMSDSLDNSFDLNDRLQSDQEYLNQMRLKLQSSGPDQFKNFQTIGYN